MSDPKTIQGGVRTTEGIIPHRAHSQGFLMPIRIVSMRSGYTNTCPERERSNHRLVYALPGGGRWIDR